MIVRQYKRLQMLIAFWALNNITAHSLFITHYGVLLDQYRHQTTNNFKKLLEQEDAKNTLKVAISIFLIIGMQIGPTRLLEVGLPNAKYNLERKLCKKCTGADLGNDGEIKGAMTADNNKDDDKENLWDENRGLKKENQCQKRATAKAGACQ